MPGKKGSKSSDHRISVEHLRRIWGEIDVMDWLNLLRQACPQTNWVYQRRLIKGKCPFHDDNQPSFYVDIDRKQAKCWGGDCGKYFWDPIRFYQALQNLGGGTMGYGKALSEMKNRYTLKSIPQTVVAAINKRQKHREMKKLCFEIMQGELIDCVAMAKMPVQESELFYARDAVAFLEWRQITGAYHFMPIGVFPPQLRMEKLVNQRLQLMPKEQAQGFKDVWDDIKVYLEAPWGDTKWPGSLAFFTGASPNDVCKIKLRRVPQRTATEYQKQNFDKDICFIQDEQETNNGAFGLFGCPPYWNRIGRDEQKVFFWVEGELDVLSVMSRQFADNGQINAMVFGGGGTSTCGLDLMKSFGFFDGYILQDHDSKGPGFVQRVLEQTVHVQPRIFEWPERLLRNPDPMKPVLKVDPDQAIVWHGLDAFQEEIRSQENFVPPHIWTLERASKEMATIDPSDIRHLTNVAANWGRYVKNEAEQHAFVTAIGARFSVAPGQILAEMKTGEENEDAFIERWRAALAARLVPIQSYRSGGSIMLRVWDKVTKDIYDLAVEEKGRIKSSIASMVGTDILKFMQDEVGEPSFMEISDEKEASNTNYIPRTNKAVEYLSFAISRLKASLPADSTMRKLGSGLHCVAPTPDEPDEPFRLYLVNGTSFYRGDYDDADILVWRQMPGPCDGSHVIFAEGDLRPRRFLPFVKTEADLNQRPTMTLEEMYSKLYDMISAGWEFVHHDITCEMLTALVMNISIASCVPRQLAFLFTSETSSGKSSFIGGFVGRYNVPAINVVYSAFGTDNFTVAGVRQSVNNSSLAVCLDEFEDKGGNDRKSAIIRGVLHLLRGQSNEEGLTILGSASGASQEFRIHCPALVAGIRGLEDVADINRFIRVSMQKRAHRLSPENILLDQFGETGIHKVRHNLPLLMYQNARTYHQAYKDIADEYRKGADFEFSKLSRSMTHLYPILAMLKICGKDYNKFIRNYFQQHRMDYERIANLSLNSSLLDSVLHTPAITVTSLESSREQTVNEVLSGDQPEVLNQSHSGVFYDRTQDWVLVHWPNVKTTILKHDPDLRRREAHWLREQAARSPYHVPEDVADRDGIYQRLARFLGFAAAKQVCSVFSMKKLREAFSYAPAKHKGHEDFNMLEEYRAVLDKITPPKPPVRAKKAPTNGTSTGSTPLTVEEPHVLDKDPNDEDDGLNW